MAINMTIFNGDGFTIYSTTFGDVIARADGIRVLPPNRDEYEVGDLRRGLYMIGVNDEARVSVKTAG
jgi:hypothetical protein